MLDKHVVPLLKSPLQKCAHVLLRLDVSADTVSFVGFFIGIASVVAVAVEQYHIALILLLINRLADGVDGELARITRPTDTGAFLDIVLDFVFYALFALGFAFAQPEANALPAAVLIASFVGTGASFLAFSDMAHRAGLEHPDFSYKGLYYLDGLAEGTETVLFFVLMCLLPAYFVVIAWVFAGICALTAINRVVFGYLTLKSTGQEQETRGE